MKQQWRKFLQDNEDNWSYGIVPELVERLAMAVDIVDKYGYEIEELLDSLYYQGVMIDEKGDLCFDADYIAGRAFYKGEVDKEGE